MDTNNKGIILSVLTIGFGIGTNLVHALPFNITPKEGTSLPTLISPGQSVVAYYTVKNNTHSSRHGNYVKWLPPNAKQITGPGLCDKKFDLAATGECTLALAIEGSINFNDPDPHHHLFVCFSDTTTCAGPQPGDALNVAIQENTFSIAGGPYYTGSNPGQGYFPLIALSNNEGSTWSYPVSADNPQSLPPNISSDQNNVYHGSSCSANLCAMGGQYNIGAISYPILALSNDGGLTWTYPIKASTHLPGGMTPTLSGFAGIINKVKCLGTLCAAVGQYATSTGAYPLLAITLDAGKSWKFPISALSNLPVGAAPSGNGVVGVLYGVDCTGTRCAAVGTYNTSPGTSLFRPFVALSEDSGITWTYPIDNNSNYPGGIYGATGNNFQSISCNNMNCTMSGRYNSTGLSGSHNYLIVGHSTDGGRTWNYPINSNTASQPATSFISTPYNKLSCDGSRCILGGYYSTGLTDLPYLAVSQDHGQTWTYAVNDGLNLPSPATNFGYFNDVSCSGNLCIGVGGYTDNIAGYPFIIQSQDGGITWNYVVSSAHLPIDAQPDTAGEVSMNSASCNKHFCMSGGYYYNGSGYFPMIATTQDGGNTWSFPVNSDPATLPRDAVAEPTGQIFFFGTASSSAGMK